MNAHVDLPHFLPWLTFVACWVSLGVAVLLAHRIARPWLLRLEPLQRATLLFQFSLMPFLVATAVTVLSYAPGVGGTTVIERCAMGADCLRHIPVFCAQIIHAILISFGLAALSGVAIWVLYSRLSQGLSLNRILCQIADLQPDQPRPQSTSGGYAAAPRSFKIIETHQLLACCAGLFRGRLIVSRGLVQTLNPSELAAVLEHEQTHSDRYDNARRLLTLISLWPIPRALSTPLLQDLDLASEAVCDREAARRTGDVQTVISAARTIMQHKQPLIETGRAGFAQKGANASQSENMHFRIAELLDSSKRHVPELLLNLATLVVYAYAIVGLTEVAHHVAESLI